MIDAQMNFDLRQLDSADDIYSDLAPHVVTKFLHFHALNPHILDLFLRYARQAKASGRKRYGIACVTERVRWHVSVETQGDDFKINNNLKSCYARLMMSMDPNLIDLFQVRRSPGTVPQAVE